MTERENRCAEARARATDARPGGARRLGPPSRDEIRAVCAEYRSAESAYATVGGCGSVARVREACDRYVRAQVALEAIGMSLPETHQSMAELSSAEDEYARGERMLLAPNVTYVDPEVWAAKDRAAIRLEQTRERVLRGVAQRLERAPSKRRALPHPPERRPRQRRSRSHRAVAKPTAGGDSGDEPPAEPPGDRRGAADITVIIERRPDPARREALIEFLVGLVTAPTAPGDRP